MRIARQEIVDNHARLAERDAVFRRFGYDVDRSAAFVLSHALPLSGKILEIGTGKGGFLTDLLAYVSRVTSIDVDPAAQRCALLNVAFEKPPGRARFMIADAADLPWSDHAFDSVVSVNALHHMKNVQRVIGEILRVAKPGGKIVLADFNSRGFAIMNKVYRYEKRIHERFPCRLKELARRFAICGWTAVLRSDECLDVMIAVKASAHGDGMTQKGSRITSTGSCIKKSPRK